MLNYETLTWDSWDSIRMEWLQKKTLWLFCPLSAERTWIQNVVRFKIRKKDIIHQNQHKLSLTYFKSCKPRHFWMGSVRGARCCPSMSQPSKLKNVTKVILYIKCTEYHVKIQVKKNAQPYKQTKKKKKINTPDGLKSRWEIFRMSSIRQKRVRLTLHR